MFDVVIPAQNEEKSILAVLATVLKLPVKRVILVLNGCTDRTLELTRSIFEERIHTIYFAEPLGIDVPRAIGALYARSLQSQGVLFVDGDMSGNVYEGLAKLLTALTEGIDVALTNCYPYITHRAKLANLVLKFRGNLNKELGYFQILGNATPTHGPHALSAQALKLFAPGSHCHTSLTLVYAKRLNLKVKVATSIPHQELKSPRKHRRHARLIAETIIGDCVMGLTLARNTEVTRTLGKHEMLGYHPQRRFDILKLWEESLNNSYSFCENHLIIPKSSLS